METSELELKNLIQRYRLSCRIEAKSPRTIEWYTSFLERFYRFLEQNGLPTYIDKLSNTSIRQFVLYLQQEARTPHTNMSLSDATVQGYVRTLKAFFAWVVREGYIADSPMATIRIPKVTIKVKNTFSAAQVESLLQTCRLSGDSGQRNLAIMLLMLDTGI
ncbi:MAG: phage integrase N-terminal SAM-like domain-containing protein, partial [Dehalococcoidales bacterium]